MWEWPIGEGWWLDAEVVVVVVMSASVSGEVNHRDKEGGDLNLLSL